MQNSALFILFTTVLLLSACGGNSTHSQSIQQSDTPHNEVALKQFNSCQDLQQKLIDNWVENLLSYERYFDDIGILPVAAGVEESFSTTDSVSTSADGLTPDEVSQTNVQESGVDEADSVKADSQGNLFIAQHDKLVIADAFPPQSMNILSQVDLGGYVAGLYLSEPDHIVAALVRPVIPFISPVTETDIAIAPYIEHIPKTDLILIDVSDLANPVISKKIQIDGHLISSRRIGSRLHLVQGYHLNSYRVAQDIGLEDLLDAYHAAYEDRDTVLMDNIKSSIRLRLVDSISSDQIQALLPKLRVFLNDIAQPDQSLSCAELNAPDIDLTANHLLTVTSLDILGENIERIAVIGSGWITYASQNDLFIVQPGSHWWWDSDQHQQSAIHHFSLADLKPAYLSTGLVKGYLNDSFSMSYYQDNLRIASTQNLWGQENRSDIRSTNHLYVLADNADNGMDIIGSVENYADNERIFSARFLGDKAFVVTFRQVDPLFSFNLSDPAQPFIAGELKIPGFSTYMHPIDDNHLLTIGRDGTANGAINQVAIKLFDVSDLSSPELIDSYTPELGNGYSWSEANWDHHAFTYYSPEQMLAIPLSSYNSTSTDYFMGIMALDVDIVSGLSLAGLVDHNDLVQQANCDNSIVGCDVYYNRWLARPTRSVFMTEGSENYLYTLSNIGLKANNTDDFTTTTGSLLLPSAQSFYLDYY